MLFTSSNIWLFRYIYISLHATGEFLLQILLFAQHVSGTFMPIIRSSRVSHKWLLPAYLVLVLMGIKVPETCWANNKICNKNSSVASSWHFISTYYRRCRSKPHKTTFKFAGYYIQHMSEIPTITLYACCQSLCH
jgi:hypothetical protein